MLQLRVPTRKFSLIFFWLMVAITSLFRKKLHTTINQFEFRYFQMWVQNDIFYEIPQGLHVHVDLHARKCNSNACEMGAKKGLYLKSTDKTHWTFLTMYVPREVVKPTRVSHPSKLRTGWPRAISRSVVITVCDIKHVGSAKVAQVRDEIATSSSLE